MKESKKQITTSIKTYRSLALAPPFRFGKLNWSGRAALVQATQLLRGFPEVTCASISALGSCSLTLV